MLSRHFDPTPIKVRFGRLQGLLAPHARYLVPEGERYRSVKFDEFRSFRPHVRVKYGVLELMAQQTEISFAVGIGSSLVEQHKFVVKSKPVFMQAATASVTHTCVESSVPNVSVQGCLMVLVCTAFNDCHLMPIPPLIQKATPNFAMVILVVGMEGW